MAKNTSKHLLWIVPLLLILIAAGWIFYKFKNFEKPAIVDMDTDVIVPGQSKTAQLSSTVYIYNPNDMEAHVDSLNFKIYMDGQQYSTGRKTEGFTIKANETTAVSIPYTYDLEKFTKNFEKTQRDSSIYKIDGELFVDIWKFNSVRIPFSFEKNRPVFKALKPEIENVKLIKFGLKETIVELTVKMHNPNDIALSTEDISYSFVIEDNVLAEGSIPADKFFPKEGTNTITAPVTMNLKETIGEIGIFRKKYEGKDYSINLNTLIKTKSKDMQTMRLDIAKTGKVDELIETMKEKREENKKKKN